MIDESNELERFEKIIHGQIEKLLQITEKPSFNLDMWECISARVGQVSPSHCTIHRVNLPYAAGAVSVLREFSREFLRKEGLKTPISLEFLKNDVGYKVKIVGDMSLEYLIQFYENDKMLCEEKINSWQPSNIIPFKNIENWTTIKILED